MKLTSVKSMVAKVVTTGVVAGAFVLASPAKAQAQNFAIGVQLGGPQYGYAEQYGGGYGYDEHRYWEHERHERREREEMERREAWARQQQWNQERHFEHERREHEREYRRGYPADYGSYGGYYVR